MSAADNTIALPFLAGLNDENDPVFEELQVEVTEESPLTVRLLRSPLFARNYAAGDRIKVVDAAAADYELVQRSGNLCVRVFRRYQLDVIAESLTLAIEKLDGSLDLVSEHALVYSIHVSIGFQTIETLLNNTVADYPDTVWYYGNVYDPVDGTTPLGWWQEFENQN